MLPQTLLKIQTVVEGFGSLLQAAIHAQRSIRHKGLEEDFRYGGNEGPVWAGSVGASQQDQSTFFVQSIGSRHRRQFQTIALVQRGHGSSRSPKARRAGTCR